MTPGSQGGISIEQLAEAMRAVLRRCPELPVVAIRWMHLKHPLHPVQQQLLRGAVRPGAFRLMKRLIQCIGYALWLTGVLAVLRVALRRPLALLARRRFDLIAATCCFTPAPADGRDFYYGDLAERLAKQDLHMLVICSDLWDGNPLAFAKAQGSTSPAARISELCLAPLSGPMRLMARQLGCAWRLSRLAASSADPLIRRIAALAATDCLAPDTANSGLRFWVAREAVRRWAPRAFLTFYEGHAWERCAWWGVKAADPSCRTVGYQHAMVFRESFALTRPWLDLDPPLLPDVVLCLGQAALELLRPGHAGSRVTLVPFGSFRSPGPASNGAGPADPARRTVLVVPEGVEEEALALFDFAAACARRLPSHTFILRAFPGLSMPRAAAAMRRHAAAFPNVIASDRCGLDEDVARSSVVLYRGSSAVLYAALRGLLPVFLDVEGMAETDPLYPLTADWRRRCSRPQEFEAIVEEHERLSAGAREERYRTAAAYLTQYAPPVDDGAVQGLLEAVDCGAS